VSQTAKISRLIPDLVCERGSKDKLLWAIPDDAVFLCVWSDPVSGDTISIASDGITPMMRDHLVLALMRRAIDQSTWP
jgi:hypothetical protein